MKRGVLARSSALDLEQPTGSDRDAQRRDRRLGCRSAAPGPDRFGIGRLPLRRRSSTSQPSWPPARPRSISIRRPPTGVSKASSCCWARCLRSNFLRLTGAYRFRYFSDLGAAIGRASARLAADAGHAVRRRLLLRSDHRHQRPLDRPVVLPGRRVDRGEPHRAQPPGQDLAACRPSLASSSPSSAPAPWPSGCCAA